MIIALTGEGKNDYGQKEFDRWVDGVAQVYIEKIVKEHRKSVSIEIIERKDVENQNHPLHLQRNIKGIKGKGIPARRFRLLAQMNDYKYGIYYCDSDKKETGSSHSESRAKKDYEELYNNVQSGLRLNDEDNSFIPMIPHRMLENWILADVSAIQKCFKCTKEKTLKISKPEMLWGKKNDPNSDYPKNYLDRVVQSFDKRYKKHVVDTEDMRRIAEASDLNVIKKNCPISFERFYKDMIRLFIED